MKYLIKGDTFQIKEDLKAYACRWILEKKCWVTPDIEKDELSFKKIDSLARAVDAELIPVKLSKKEEEIQRILNNG